MQTQLLDVSHQHVTGIAMQRPSGQAPAATPLVEQDRPTALWIKQLAMPCGAATAGAAMQKNYGQTFCRSALLVVDAVAIAHLEPTGVVGFQRRIQCIRQSHLIHDHHASPFRHGLDDWATSDGISRFNPRASWVLTHGFPMA